MISICLKMSFESLFVMQSIYFNSPSFCRGCQNGSVHVWTLPQGGTTVSLPKVKNSPPSQDTSTDVKVSLGLMLELLFTVLILLIPYSV